MLEGYGKYQTMGLTLAVEEINAKGGVLGHRIEILSEDDESRPAPAARKAEKLILQDGVKLLIGAVSSSATMAVMDVTRKYKTIQWNSVACAEFMRTTKFHKYYFSNQPDARMQARGVATYILEKVGTKAYVLYTDYAMGQVGVSDGRQFKMAFEKAGGQVVGAAGVPADASSLRLMTQLHAFGMTKKYRLAGIDCFLLPQDLPAVAGPMEGFIQITHFSPHDPDPNMKAFNDKFKTRWGVDANIAAGAYDAVYFWKTAVEKAGSFDADKVAEAHEGLCLEATHTGRQCIRTADHQVVMDLRLYRVQPGKSVPGARIAGSDAIGEPLVGKNPLAGFTWDIKQKR